MLNRSRAKMARECSYLYPLLVVAFFLQITIKSVWMPDLVLILVVFAGIFRAPLESFIFALITGLLRGCFSPGTFYMDILLFPAVGYTSSLLAGLFYKYNPLVHVMVAAVGMLLVITVQVFYLNSVFDNNISFLSTFFSSWRTFILTTALAPFMFSLMKGLRRSED